MTTDTVLTEEQIQQAVQCITAEQSIVDGSVVLSNVNVCFLALEQAVLQSPEVQRLREDAERYRWLRRSDTGPATLDSLHSWVNDDCNPPYRELKYGNDLDTAIDSAMEKHP